MRWPYYIPACLFAGCGYYLGWLGKDVLVWPSFAAALVCVFLANLDRIKSIKAGGIEATLSEARLVVREARDLALVSSKLLLSLVQRAGRLGGYKEDKKREIQEAVDHVLARFNASELERRDVYSDWDAYVKIDYVFAILGGGVPTSLANKPEESKQWHALRKRNGQLDPPTPNELWTFLSDNDLLPRERNELIEDYRYYIEHFRHRRPEAWEEHSKWERKAIN